MGEESREAAEWEELEREQLLSSLSESEQEQYGELVRRHGAKPDMTCSSCGASDLWWYTATGWLCQCAADGRGRRLPADAAGERSTAPWPQRRPMQPVKQRRLAEEEESPPLEEAPDRRQL